MKRVIIALLVVSMLFMFTGCQNPTEEEKNDEKESSVVTLTKENIGDYVTFEGEVIDYDKWQVKGMPYMTGAEATVDFKAHAIAGGSFENVEITLQISGYKYWDWHLSDDKDATRIKFTFKMPASGEYSSKYKVSNGQYVGTSLNGKCDFDVVSVTGTFKPTK